MRRLQSQEAIIEEITQSVWDEQNEETQQKLVDDVSKYDNIEDGLRKSALVTKLAKQAKSEEKISSAEKRQSKANRDNILKNLDKNYERYFLQLFINTNFMLRKFCFKVNIFHFNF